MTIMGSDPDQLKSTAHRVLTLADNYENANQQIAYWLRRMNWEGPEAERFHVLYQSHMRPQLDAAAAFLRQASTELRVQAADQLRVSANQRVIVDPTCSLPGPWLLDDLAGRIGGALEGLFNDSRRVLDVAGLLRHLDADWGVDVAKRVANFLKSGSGVPLANMMTVFGGATAIAFMPLELYEFSKDIVAVDWQDQDSLERMMYSGSDVLMGVGSAAAGIAIMLGMAAPPAAAVIVGIGFAIKAGTFIIDNWDTISGYMQSAYDFTAKAADIFIEYSSEFVGDVAREAGGGVRR